MAEFDFDNAPAVRCTALEKRYPDVLAVAGIDLEVRAGECLAVLGPNGAGKTTTVEMIEGLTAPSAGRIEVFGRPWGQGARSDRAIRGVIGVQLQETHFQEKLTIDETLAMFSADSIGDDDIHTACVAAVAAADFAEERGSVLFKAAIAAIRSVWRAPDWGERRREMEREE